MTPSREDVIRMAREAGYFLYDLTETHGIKTVETDEEDQWAQLERFASLVAAAERDALLKHSVKAHDVDGHCDIVLAADIQSRNES